MHDNVTAWTWMCAPINLIVIKWNLKVWPWSFREGRVSWCGTHLCQAISKSHNVWQCYNPDTNTFGMHRQTDRQTDGAILICHTSGASLIRHFCAELSLIVVRFWWSKTSIVLLLLLTCYNSKMDLTIFHFEMVNYQFRDITKETWSYNQPIKNSVW
jgi:hypothetical protein